SIWVDRTDRSPLYLLSVDDILYDKYLRKALAYTMWGDFFHGHTHSPVNLYGDHIVSNEVQKNGGPMEHINGLTREGSWWIDDAKISNNTGGKNLLQDMLELFYEAQAVNDTAYNVTEVWEAKQVDGLASYRFETLPERVETKVMAANHDLSEIAGVVRILGAAGEDTININAEASEALTAGMGTETLHLGEFIFDGDPMDTSDVRDAQTTLDDPDATTQEKEDAQAVVDTARTARSAWLEEIVVSNDGETVRRVDVQDGLIRAHKETDPNIIDDLLDGSVTSYDVEVSIDRAVPGTTGLVLTLGAELTSLKATWDAVDDITANTLWYDSATESATTEGAARQGWFNGMKNFIDHGLYLAGEVATDTATAKRDQFSLDTVNAYLASDQLEFLLSNASGADLTKVTAVQTALTELRDYLTLVSTNSGLTGKSHTPVIETGLRIYKQNSPDLGGSTSTRYYWDDLWTQADVNLGNN
ncbi:MAG: hypothetical protein ACPH5V_08485, partial [Alcanivorax sp.]